MALSPFFRKNRKILITLAGIFLALAILFAVCAVYVNDFYHTDTATVEAFAASPTVHVTTGHDGMAFVPPNATAGLIFYPGGKVEFTAYVPLMQALAARGILCVLPEMPFHLAVLDINAADGIRELYPYVETWYIGGHSLGGSMAASYLEKHAEDFAGLLLLGSYSTADLSHTGLSALSVYGSEDGVMNREKYAENLPHLPTNFKEVVIEGGNHAGFGAYGAQKGDGTASITVAEQINITADHIAAFWEVKNEQKD